MRLTRSFRAPPERKPSAELAQSSPRRKQAQAAGPRLGSPELAASLARRRNRPDLGLTKTAWIAAAPPDPTTTPAQRPARETPAHARRRVDVPAPHPTEGGAVRPSVLTSGAAAGGGCAVLSPRGLVLGSLRGRGCHRRCRAGAPQTGSAATPRPAEVRGPRRCDPARLRGSPPPGAEGAPSRLRADPRARAGGGRGRPPPPQASADAR